MTKGFKEVNSSVNTLINNIDKTSTKVASLESKLENLEHLHMNIINTNNSIKKFFGSQQLAKQFSERFTFA